jgi:hypothetical protein
VVLISISGISREEEALELECNNTDQIGGNRFFE